MGAPWPGSRCQAAGFPWWRCQAGLPPEGREGGNGRGDATTPPPGRTFKTLPPKGVRAVDQGPHRRLSLGLCHESSGTDEPQHMHPGPRSTKSLHVLNDNVRKPLRGADRPAAGAWRPRLRSLSWKAGARTPGFGILCSQRAEKIQPLRKPVVPDALSLSWDLSLSLPPPCADSSKGGVSPESRNHPGLSESPVTFPRPHVQPRAAAGRSLWR